MGCVYVQMINFAVCRNCHNFVKQLCCCLVTVMSDSVSTPQTVACQVLPSMGFSRQEYWSGLPCPSPGDLLNTGIKPTSPVQQADSTAEPPGKPKALYSQLKKNIHYINPGLSFICLLYSFIFISWRLIALQYCSGFCHTLT